MNRLKACFGHLSLPLVVLCVSIAAFAGCGGGPDSIVGIANGIGGGERRVKTLEAVAEALVASRMAPEVGEEELRRVFSGVLQRARSGDPEAALIVLLVAEGQAAQREGQAEESEGS